MGIEWGFIIISSSDQAALSCRCGAMDDVRVMTCCWHLGSSRDVTIEKWAFDRI